MTYLLRPLNPLRAFEAAARHLSFKFAAQELHVTPVVRFRGNDGYRGMPTSFHRNPL